MTVREVIHGDAMDPLDLDGTLLHHHTHPLPEAPDDLEDTSGFGDAVAARRSSLLVDAAAVYLAERGVPIEVIHSHFADQDNVEELHDLLNDVATMLTSIHKQRHR